MKPDSPAATPVASIPAVTSVPASSTTPEPQVKKTTILLVEDDPILSNMYNAKFQIAGFNVLIAEDGEIGLKKALEESYDLIILDIMMPKLSGTDLLEQLRATDKGKTMPVIVITNLSDFEEKKKIESLNVYAMLVKADITPSQLVEYTKKALHL